MTRIRETFRDLVAEAFFADFARPIEWINVLALSGWLQFLLTRPEEFASDRYAAFSSLSPSVWAVIIGMIVIGQLVAMRPSRFANGLRFVAMMFAAGIWTTIAVTFWTVADVSPLSARTNTVLALAACVTAVYLGLARRS